MVTSFSSSSFCLLNRHDLGRPPKSPVTPETVARARAWRLKRLREQIAAHDCAAILIYNPVNIRYAFDYTNMQIGSTREAIRYGLVFADGPGIMHEGYQLKAGQSDPGSAGVLAGLRASTPVNSRQDAGVPRETLLRSACKRPGLSGYPCTATHLRRDDPTLGALASSPARCVQPAKGVPA